MRAPFQILAIPYRFVNQVPVYCVFHRIDSGEWQFIAGGGEDNETPLQAARREISEEGGVLPNRMMELKSMCYIPTNIFPKCICTTGRRIPMLCQNMHLALNVPKK